MKVILFVAASLIATLSGALVGALTRELSPADASVEGCFGAACSTHVRVPSIAPNPIESARCDEAENATDRSCFADPAALGHDDDDDDDGGDDGDNSGPGSDSSGPG